VARLGVGEVDLSSELGVQLGPDEHELLWVRSQLVMYSAAAGLDAPVGPVWTDIEDLAGLRRSSEGLRRLGYVGRACIHPAQIPVVREVFTPSPAEIAQAEHLVERYDAAIAIGQGVIKDDRGAMVDEAVVRAARRTLAAISRV
ncbi:MAG: HpcH/HpaI aldolase/citrate lyase family protein, partial [Acidimicrobiales bacterium]